VLGASPAEVEKLRDRVRAVDWQIAGTSSLDEWHQSPDRAASADLVVVSADALRALRQPDVPRAVAASSRDSPRGASGDERLIESLTARERDVLVLVADGLPNRSIAHELGISEHTVKFHLASIFGKLGASSRVEAVRRGLDLGLIEL
jgi:DNA-binding NarL/FixJ family response regulator